MKINVVTGGGSGIGKAIADMLPQDETVVITGRNLEKLNRAAAELNAGSRHAVCVTCDVSNRADVRKLAEHAASLGEIGRVINCAGVSGSMADRETIIRINALGTVYINQEFYRVMTGGVICNIASDSAYLLPKLLLPSEKTFRLAIADEGQFLRKMMKKAKLLKDESVNCQMAYMISKNFVKWYSRKCAYKYMATKGIRVFSVSPGFVNTPMTDKEKGEATDVMLSYSGLHRGAEPEELAYLVASLADERCSYLIGEDVICDAGCVGNGYSFLVATKKYDDRSLKENW